MQQFKIGDWVRHVAEAKVFQIVGVHDLGDEFFYSDNCRTHKANKLKHWQPQKGEWCWFYDNTSSAVPILAQFDYMSEHTYVTTEIEIPLSEEERSAYGFNSCIPFIGQLPRILKDRV